MFGLPLTVRTPSRVLNAQFVSVLVAVASSVRLCATRSPVPTTLPANAVWPPCGHCLVIEKVVLIGTGVDETAADEPLPSVLIENDRPGPKSAELNEATPSKSVAS